jgi:hypothetical protein
MASRGEQLGVTMPAGESSWRRPGLQGRAVRGDQACRRGQLGVIRLAGECLGGDQAGRQKQLGAIRKAGRGGIGSQQSWIVRGMSNCPGSGLNRQSDIPREVPDWRRCRLS